MTPNECSWLGLRAQGVGLAIREVDALMRPFDIEARASIPTVTHTFDV